MPDSRPAEAFSGADDDARIEYLLVTGLDHYFAGEYEHAINLWTRVLFLDRNHDRARAYIERARSAQAEQQRISEVLIHEGLEAFDRGEVVRARTLLSDALDQGASNDVALGVLGRIDRLDVGSRVPLPAQPDVRRKAAPRTAAVFDANQRRSTLTLWWVTTAAIVLISLMAFVLNSPGVLAEWFPEQAAASPAAPTPAPLTPLPVPSPTESYLAQARTLFSSGKLRDALHALDRVPMGDSSRAEADRLRADIQRELLAVAGAETSTALSQAPPVPRNE